MAASFSSTQSPLVGKYLYVERLEFSPYGESWGFECYCLSFDNGIYTVRNKFGQVYKASINQITKIIDITEQQKYRVGDIVEAKIDYLQKDGDWSTDYCQIISVKNFANDFDYVLKNIKTGQIIDKRQNYIVKVVTMQQPKYMLGTYVGMKHMIGVQWDPQTVIKNGTIIKVNAWYDRVTYDIKLDTGEIKTDVFDYSIVAPAVVKTKQQIDQENIESLRQEEERLLRQLEMVRAARALVQ